jgi:hypothetical protein
LGRIDTFIWMSAGVSVLRRETIRFNCGGCGACLSVPKRLAGARGECPVCREWIEAPRPPGGRRGWRAAPAPFSARWIIGPANGNASNAKPASAPQKSPYRGKRRSKFKKWLRQLAQRIQRWRGVLSLGALAFLAATYYYLRHVNWQLPWRLSEESLQGWLTNDAVESGAVVPLRPRGR